MPSPSPTTDLDRLRRRIAETVRELRRARHLTQKELAGQLGLSQSRLSEIERGAGSFTAEQLLLLRRLFNVDIGAFEGATGSRDPAVHDAVLQNALIRHGAVHLRQVPDVPVTDRYRSAAAVVQAVLLAPGSERFVTALAPVLVACSEQLALTILQAELVKAGRPRRLPWLVDNSCAAIDAVAADVFDPRWRKQALRARVILSEFLAHLPPAAVGADAPPRDPLDPGVRSEKTLERTWSEASPISRRWGVASEIQVEDFADALRQAHASH